MFVMVFVAADCFPQSVCGCGGGRQLSLESLGRRDTQEEKQVRVCLRQGSDRIRDRTEEKLPRPEQEAVVSGWNDL